MAAIDRWVVDKVLKEHQAFGKDREVRLSINLSGTTIPSGDLSGYIYGKPFPIENIKHSLQNRNLKLPGEKCGPAPEPVECAVTINQVNMFMKLIILSNFLDKY